MKSNLNRYMKNLDLFAMHYSLYFDGRHLYRTSLGGILTLITGFFIVALVYVIGEEILWRDHPKDLLNVDILPVPKNMTFDVSTAFVMEHYGFSNGLDDNEKYLRFEGLYHDIEYYDGNNQDKPGFPKIIKTRNCNFSDFPDYVSDQYINMELDSATCFDNGKFEIGGDFTTDYVKFIEMMVKPCKNSTLNNNSCASVQEIKNYLRNGVSVSLHSAALQYNSYNYSYPLAKYIAEDNYIVDPLIYKEFTYTVQEFNVKTDQGIFWTEYFKHIDYKFDAIKVDFSSIPDNYPEESYSDLVLSRFKFISSVNTPTHTRGYLKGKEVITICGVVLKMYLVLIHFCIYFIYNRRMDETVVAKLFSITKEDLIEGESVHAEPVFNIKRLKHQASFVGASPMREMRDNRSSEANFKLFQSDAVTSRTDLRGEADKAAQSNSIRRDQKTPTNPSIMISPKIKLKHSPSLHSPNNSIPFSAQDPLRCQKTPIPANIQIKPVEVNEDTTHSLSRRTYQNFINKKINKKVNPNLRRMKRLFTTSEYIFLKLLPCCYHKKTK
jgi:hypothetical protein